MAFRLADQVVAIGSDFGIGTVIEDRGSILGVQTYQVRWPTVTLNLPEDSIRLATVADTLPAPDPY